MNTISTYCDYNATTPLDERVLEAMLPYLRDYQGNASSRHSAGRKARQAIDAARQQVARALNVQPEQVIFTSGGSEANNLFIRGAAATKSPGVIALGAAEHPSIGMPGRHLQAAGWRVQKLAVEAAGHIDVRQAKADIATHRPGLVSVMLANNECGAVNDVATLAEVTNEQGGWLHTDAVQALGRMPLDFKALGVQAMSVSSHKIGGPMGAGALILDKQVELAAQIAGGGQERALRSGTENVAAIVGFGRACELCSQELDKRIDHMRSLQLRFEAGLAGINADIVLFGGIEPRLPNTSFFAFEGIEGEALVARLDEAGFAIAGGSACSSASAHKSALPSSTLLAMGVPVHLARGAVRVSLGTETKQQDVENLLHALQQSVNTMRAAMVAV